MPVQIDVSIPVTEIKTVSAIKSIYRAVLADGLVYWEINIEYDGVIVMRKHYNCPYLDLFGTAVDGQNLLANSFEDRMIAKANEIDTLLASAEKTAMLNKAIDEIKYKEV